MSQAIDVYRLVKSSPPQKEDFLPTKREYPHRQFPDECAAYGVSVYIDKECVLNTKSKYPKLRSLMVAKGKINLTDGVVKQTFSKNHLTWWLKTDDPHLNFKVLDHV